MQRIDAEWPPWLESRSVSKADGTSGHNPVLFVFWTEEKRGACEWFKILNWEYSQMQGREKLFERERHGTCCRIGFLHVSL